MAIHWLLWPIVNYFGSWMFYWLHRLPFTQLQIQRPHLKEIAFLTLLIGPCDVSLYNDGHCLCVISFFIQRASPWFKKKKLSYHLNCCGGALFFLFFLSESAQIFVLTATSAAYCWSTFNYALVSTHIFPILKLVLLPTISLRKPSPAINLDGSYNCFLVVFQTLVFLVTTVMVKCQIIPSKSIL